MNSDSPFDLESRYEELLLKYNELKEDIRCLPSQKQIDQEISHYSHLLTDFAHSNQGQDCVEGEAESQHMAKMSQLRRLMSEQQAKLCQIKIENQRKCRESEKLVEEHRLRLSQMEKNASSQNSQIQQLQLERQRLSRQVSQQLHQIKNLNQQLVQKEQKNSQYIEQISEGEKGEQKVYVEEIGKLKQERDILQQQLNKTKQKYSQLMKEDTSERKEEYNDEEVDRMEHIIRGKKSTIETMENQLDFVQIEHAQAQNKRKSLTAKHQSLSQEWNFNKNREKELKKQIHQVEAEREQFFEESKKRRKTAENELADYSRLKNQNKLLQEEHQRVTEKLEKYLQLKGTYLKPEKLFMLKEEQTRVSRVSRSLENYLKTYNKLAQTHSNLIDHTKRLRQSERKMVNQKERQYNQTRDKVKECLETRVYLEKTIAHSQKKLKLYMENFPNHEKEKIEKKQLQKQEKAKQKREKKKREQAELLKRKQSQILKKKEAEKELDTILTQTPTKEATHFQPLPLILFLVMAVLVCVGGYYWV